MNTHSRGSAVDPRKLDRQYAVDHSHKAAQRPVEQGENFGELPPADQNDRQKRRRHRLEYLIEIILQQTSRSE